MNANIGLHSPDQYKSISNSEKTLVSLFENSVEKYPKNIMFREKLNDKYEATPYREMHSRILKFAGGLVHLGVTKGDRVALLAQARKDWITAELGILYTGAINVPLSVKLESQELLFRLKHAGVKILVISSYMYPRLKDPFYALPELQKIILLDPMEEYTQNEIFLEDLLQYGEAYIKGNKKQFQNIVRAVKEDDCALISYTSGTTADPKGIMLSHKNLYTNCEQSLQMFSVAEDYRILFILPLDHSFAHTTGMYVFLASGASLASVQLGRTPAATLKNVFTNIKEIRPDTLLSVPTVAKNLKKNIENGIRKKGFFTRLLFDLGLKMTYSYNGLGWDRGKGRRKFYRPFYKLFDQFIFSAVRENFGGRLKYFVGGGALLDIELQKFFLAIGMPMYQGYGLSEASPVISSNTIQEHKMGSSGKIVPNLKVKICDEAGNMLPTGQKGEIVVKGDNVMRGYYKNAEATHGAIKEGWLYTGDMGYFDPDGFLYVLGRFKSLLIGDDGEKYSPEGIEEYIEEKSDIIHQIIIYNNQNPYTTALIYPNRDALQKHLKKLHLTAESEAGQKMIVKRIQQELDSLTDGDQTVKFPQRWFPVTFKILEEGFTEQNFLLNSTLKIVRGKIIDRYKHQIEFMYTPEGKSILNPTNLEAVHKLFH